MFPFTVRIRQLEMAQLHRVVEDPHPLTALLSLDPRLLATLGLLLPPVPMVLPQHTQAAPTEPSARLPIHLSYAIILLLSPAAPRDESPPLKLILRPQLPGLRLHRLQVDRADPRPPHAAVKQQPQAEIGTPTPLFDLLATAVVATLAAYRKAERTKFP